MLMNVSDVSSNLDPSSAARLGVDPRVERYRALLEVSESILAHRELAPLFSDLGQRLHPLVRSDYMGLILYDAERKTTRLHIMETLQPGSAPLNLEMPAADTPGGRVVETQQPLVIQDVENDGEGTAEFPRVWEMIRAQRVKSFAVLPLTTAHRRLGALTFGCVEKNAYPDEDVTFMQQVAAQVAVAVDNVLNHQAAQAYQEQLARERDRLRLLLEVNNAVVSNLELRELFAAISASLRRVMQCDYTSLALAHPDGGHLLLHALDFPEGKGLIREEMKIPIDGSPAGYACQTRRPLVLNQSDGARFPSEIIRAAMAEGLKSGCFLPLVSRDRVLGTVNLASRHDGAFSEADVDFLMQVATQIAIAVENALAFRQIEELKEKLTEEKLYLEDEIRTDRNFEEIVGESAALRRVLKQAETVAPTDSTVLIQGETGTGKEVIGRAIHNMSSRRDRTFVTINCAAIPTGLLESELFGHERGAFTGAISQKIGRFELADKGTLFLDEVGDIPPELQPKLLRVLQEQDFERLGSTRTLHVDVRLICATNRDLAAMVAAREFRSDLYYRLHVFPIVVPPLRDRSEDIQLLVQYFAQKHARRMGKRIESIPTEAMEALARYPWPGNIRELQNFIERSVILSPGSVLRPPLAELKPSGDAPPADVATLEIAERGHILRALEESRWVIGGPKGAAARLGLKRTTLQSKMQKLGISRP